MKRVTILAMVLVTAAALQAQRITKVYGFWHYQPVGTIPRIPVEEGGGKAGELYERRKVFYVYVESSLDKAPDIQKIILHNKTYTATVQKITTLPAEYEYFDGQRPQKITLVPKGRKNVFALALTEAGETVKPQKNQLVITCKAGGKTYKASLAKMKDLPISVVQ